MTDHAGKQSRAYSAGAPTRAAEPSPGKRTLTERAYGAAIQRHAEASAQPATDDVHAAAARGIESPATSLPFMDRIQASFGRQHDLTSIQAHVGGAATAAASAMGASAYATGNHVAFAGAPDLHTAAHEAAHVVQQRTGVQLHGGVGRAGDGYERQADAVADRVVQGRSAAELFGPPAAGRDRGREEGVQHTCSTCGGAMNGASECSTCKPRAASASLPEAAAVQRQPKPDSGTRDAGVDAAPADAGAPRGGATDGGVTDGGNATDAGATDGGIKDAGTPASGGKNSGTAKASNPIDKTAEGLIAVAQAETPSIDKRAVQLVTQMLSAYYSSDASKFSSIVWVENEPGLLTTCPPSGGAKLTCTLKVGRYFVENTTKRHIARRVLQLGHEIQHVDQHQHGMAGEKKRHEREFLAFHWEATAPEAAGTGRMQHATRGDLIDGAIRHYNCLIDAQKTSYSAQYQQLLTLRKTEHTASGHDETPVPTECSG